MSVRTRLANQAGYSLIELLVSAAIMLTVTGAIFSLVNPAQGNAQVFVVPEASITDGLEPGDGGEQIKDGWRVEYTKFLITIGNFRARSTATGKELRDPTVWVLDLKSAPTSGYVTARFDEIDAVRFDKVGQDMPAAAPGAKALPPMLRRGTVAVRRIPWLGKFVDFTFFSFSFVSSCCCVAGECAELAVGARVRQENKTFGVEKIERMQQIETVRKRISRKKTYRPIFRICVFFFTFYRRMLFTFFVFCYFLLSSYLLCAVSV